MSIRSPRTLVGSVSRRWARLEKCYREKLERMRSFALCFSHILSIQRRVFGKAESQVTTGIE